MWSEKIADTLDIPSREWYNKRNDGLPTARRATDMSFKFSERIKEPIMEIALIAHDLKKELMTQFCIAYCGVLSKHSLCATSITAKYISEATGLEVERLLSGAQGGDQQIASRIAYNEIDMLLYFKDTRPNSDSDDVGKEILRLCDLYNIPVATNIATAEVLVMALDRGDLDWREIVNPHSAYNLGRKNAAANNGKKKN